MLFAAFQFLNEVNNPVIDGWHLGCTLWIRIEKPQILYISIIIYITNKGNKSNIIDISNLNYVNKKRSTDS